MNKLILKLFFTLHLLFISLFAYQQTSDAKNIYLSSEHFRAIYGKVYANSTSASSLASAYLDIAENVWNKEVVKLAFKAPKNTGTKKIDIYMGNKKAYNYEAQSYETIPSNYAGWTTTYPSDDTPYFLLNPIISENISKVTIAHEFLHTIQHAYFDPSKISDILWQKDIWWIEATAVLMEDEVYNNINDYINFLGPFFNASYKSFEIYNGTHEYAMVIFAKYLKEKYGFDFIKKSFISLNLNKDKSAYQIIDSLLKTDYSSSMHSTLNEFTKWVAEPTKYFEEGKLYPSLKHFKSSDNITFGKGGVAVIDNLQKGWNMVTLTTINKDVNASSNDILPLVWSYKNSVWKNSIEHQIHDTNSSQGYWVKVDYPSSLNYTYYDINNSTSASNLNNSWHFLGVTSTRDIDTMYKGNEVLVWQYKDGKWSVYSNMQNLNEILKQENYPTINELHPFSAYWIKKF